MPPEPEQAAWDMPGPKAEPRLPLDPADWRRAEDGLGRGLAQAAEALGRLEERARRLSSGLLRRLALEEAEALARVSGLRILPGRLALHDLMAAPAGEDARDLSIAHWALRRLAAGQAPEPGGGPGPLARFLGRQPASGPAPDELAPDRPGPEEFAALVPRWEELCTGGDLHRITRAALAHHGWRMLGLSDPEDLVEPGVAAALLGGGTGAGLRFLPVARGGAEPHRVGGPPAARLAAWYEGVTRSSLSVLMWLDRLEDWRARAAEETRDLQGRTPGALLDALAATGLITTEGAAISAGCSRAAAERNLALLRTRGLVREITGQSRFRLWRDAS